MSIAAIACASRRTKRETSSTYTPPAPTGEIPGEATNVVTAAPPGGASGSRVISWDPPPRLFNGSAFGSSPLTASEVRVYRADNGALVSGFPVTVTAPASSVTVTGIPLIDVVARVTARNANGPSNESQPSEVWTQT